MSIMIINSFARIILYYGSRHIAKTWCCCENLACHIYMFTRNWVGMLSWDWPIVYTCLQETWLYNKPYYPWDKCYWASAYPDCPSNNFWYSGDVWMTSRWHPPMAPTCQLWFGRKLHWVVITASWDVSGASSVPVPGVHHPIWALLSLNPLSMV